MAIAPTTRGAADTLSAELLSHQLQCAPDSNAVVSGPGVQLLLAVAYAGVGPNPAIDALLGTSGKDRDQAVVEMLESIARLEPDVGVLDGFDPAVLPEQAFLHFAQQVVALSPLNDAYLEAASALRATVSTVSLPLAQTELDSWVARHTAGLIQRSAVTVDSQTRLVIQNAMLLAAGWEMPFNPAATLHGVPFYRGDGGASRCDLMVKTAPFTIVDGDGWQAIRIPYSQGSGLALDVVLPQKGRSLAEIPTQTWAKATAELTTRGQLAEVKLLLPKLDLSVTLANIVAALSRRGISLPALDHIAAWLPVVELSQQARLVVDEEGTVAAAVTEMMVAAGWPETEPLEFRVDRPFVLRLIDLDTELAWIEAIIHDPAV